MSMTDAASFGQIDPYLGFYPKQVEITSSQALWLGGCFWKLIATLCPWRRRVGVLV